MKFTESKFLLFYHYFGTSWRNYTSHINMLVYIWLATMFSVGWIIAFCTKNSKRIFSLCKWMSTFQKIYHKIHICVLTFRSINFKNRCRNHKNWLKMHKEKLQNSPQAQGFDLLRGAVAAVPSLGNLLASRWTPRTPREVSPALQPLGAECAVRGEVAMHCQAHGGAEFVFVTHYRKLITGIGWNLTQLMDPTWSCIFAR